MAGEGGIGGGSGCWLHFKVKHATGDEVWSAYDKGAKTGPGGTRIKITFPKNSNIQPVDIGLEPGECVQIEWK